MSLSFCCLPSAFSKVAEEDCVFERPGRRFFPSSSISVLCEQQTTIIVAAVSQSVSLGPLITLPSSTVILPSSSLRPLSHTCLAVQSI